jgi:Tol biopolymer transport system component
MTPDTSRVAFISNCDLTPGNPGNEDGNYEVFLWIADFGYFQITDSEGGDDVPGGFANLNPSISDDGKRIVFMSNRDLTPGLPGNEDENYEIFLWTEGRGIQQITDTVGGDEIDGYAHGWPVISGDGKTLAFHSTRDLTPGRPGNLDGNIEVFIWKQGRGFTQITDTTVFYPFCPRLWCPPDEPSFCGVNYAISLNKDGSRLAFYSDRDLTPGNPGNPAGDTEIFLWEEGRGITQITSSLGGCFFANRLPSMDEDGNSIAFASNRDYTGQNWDGNGELFLWRRGRGITQITDTFGGDSASVPANTNPALSRDGSAIAFWSNRSLVLGGNPFSNYELFLWSADHGFTQITTSFISEFSNTVPAINAQGTWVAFDLVLPWNYFGNRDIFLAHIER